MQPRSVLMLCHTFPPAAAAGSFRVLRFAKFLPEYGWQPLIVSVRPGSYRVPRPDESLMQWVAGDAIIHRTTVWRPMLSLKKIVKSMILRCRGGVTQRESPDVSRRSLPAVECSFPTLWTRMSNTFRSLESLLLATPDTEVGWILPAVSAALPLIRRYHPEVIYTTGPPHSAHLIGLILKAVAGIPLVTDLRDPWARPPWRSANATCWRDTAQHWLEYLCVRFSDRVVLNTVQLEKEFRGAYPQSCRSKFLVVPNGYDPDLSKKITELLPANGCSSVNGRIHLCHAGGIYGKRDLRPLAVAVGKLVESGLNVSLHQIGVVSGRAELAGFLREKGLETVVSLTDQLSYEETLEQIANAEIALVIQPGTSIQVPGKLYELLLFRKPIVALTERGATAEVIERFGLGVVAPPDNPGAIASAILHAANGRSGCCRSGWEEALNAFDGRKLTGTLAEVFEEVVGDRAKP